LQTASAGLLAQAVLPLPGWGNPKTLRGVFPILQTPFTVSDELDLDALRRQAIFLDRCGAHGMVWPQFASEFQSLRRQERLAGAEVIASAGRKLRAAVVIGVQAPDLATALAYTRHAEKLGADALIALPPLAEQDPGRILSYSHISILTLHCESSDGLHHQYP